MANNTPNSIKISVMIPVYNGGEKITSCIESVLNQTIKDYEIVIVDNNSTDNTEQVIKKYASKNKKIKYVFESKKGRGSARNTGVKNCSGEIIVMTDADCIVPNNWLEMITEPITEESEIAVMGFEYNLNKGFWSENTQKADEEFYKNISDGNYIKTIDTKNFAIKKNVFDKENFNTNISTSEDLEFYLSIKDNVKIRYLPNIKVGHAHKNTFIGTITKNIDRGYWTSKIVSKHESEINETVEKMPAFKTNAIKSVLLSPFSIFKLFLMNPLGYAFYKFVVATSWTIGMISEKMLF